MVSREGENVNPVSDENGYPYISAEEVIDYEGISVHSEERGNILQQVRVEESRNGDVSEVPAADTAQSSDTGETLQGVRGEEVRIRVKYKRAFPPEQVNRPLSIRPKRPLVQLLLRIYQMRRRCQPRI